MDYSKKTLILLPVLCCAFLFGGCYTKLASYQNEVAGNNSGGCSDCGDETPVNNRREVCVWERDIFGFPEMRCYTTNYSSSWMYFHSTPWWYRNNYRWYDTRGCPPNYYYDRVSGICRYYGASNGYRGGGGGGGGGGAGTQTMERRSIRALPEEPAPAPGVTSGSTMFTGGTKQLSPVSVPAPAANNPGLSKEQDEKKTPQQPQPPKQPSAAEQRPPNEASPPQQQQKQPPNRRSLRGI